MSSVIPPLTINEDTKSNTKAKMYKQKFRECWLEEFSPWICRSPTHPESPYCLYCSKRIEGGVCHLRRHAKSGKHIKRVQSSSADYERAPEVSSCRNLIQQEVDNQMLKKTDVASTKGAKHRGCKNKLRPICSENLQHSVQVMNLHENDSKSVHILHAQNGSLENIYVQEASSEHFVQQHIELQAVNHDIMNSTSITSSEGNLFQPTLVTGKGDIPTYMVQLSDGAAHTSVIESNSNFLTPVTETDHITVTIQGHDPMYIKSSSANISSNISHEVSDKSSILIFNSKLKTGRNVRQRASKRLKTGEEIKEKSDMPSSSSNRRRVLMSLKQSSNSTNKRWYRQKYTPRWDTSQEMAEWLTRAPGDPTTPYCIACAKPLCGGIAHLRRHSKTPYHKKRMLKSEEKRKEHMAEQAEVKLTDFAVKFGMPDAAVLGLPELLRRILPDSKLATMMSEQRLSAMLLVRKESKDGIQTHKFSTLKPKIDPESSFSNKSLELSEQNSFNEEDSLANTYICSEHPPVSLMNGGDVAHPPAVQCCSSSTCYPPLIHSCKFHPMHCQITNESQATNLLPNSKSLSAGGAEAAFHTEAFEQHSTVCTDLISLPSTDEVSSHEQYNRTPGSLCVSSVHNPSNLVIASVESALPPVSNGNRLGVHQMSVNSKHTALTDGHASCHEYSPSAPKSTDVSGSWHQRVALVVGADTGVGVVVSRRLVALGLHVIGLTSSAHVPETLTERHWPDRGSFTSLECCFTESDNVNDVLSRVSASVTAVHYYVYCPDLVPDCSLTVGCTSDWHAVLEAVAIKPVLVTLLSVRLMLQHNSAHGHVLLVDSVGRSGLRGVSAGVASTLSEELRSELKAAKSSIRVTRLMATESCERDAVSVEEAVAAAVEYVVTAPPELQINEITF